MIYHDSHNYDLSFGVILLGNKNKNDEPIFVFDKSNESIFIFPDKFLSSWVIFCYEYCVHCYWLISFLFIT